MSAGGSKLKWCTYACPTCAVRTLIDDVPMMPWQTWTRWVLSSCVLTAAAPPAERVHLRQVAFADCGRRDSRLGAHDLPPVRPSRRQVGAARLPAAARIQGDDVLERHRADRHRPRIPRTSRPSSRDRSAADDPIERSRTCEQLASAVCGCANEVDVPQSYFVEVDIVMDANTPLWKAHDISQQLQDKIEVLPNVGRAFVHVDHETTHTPVRFPCSTHCLERRTDGLAQEHRKNI